MKKILAIVFYFIAFLFGFVYLIGEAIPDVHLMEVARLFLLCGSCLFLYFGGLLLSKYNDNNKYMKINLWIFFGLYLLLLITLTLFDSMWGRNGLTFINWFSDKFLSYVKNSINLIPFKTIIEFVKEFNSMYGSRTIILNLFGNFIALMPMAFFLPLLFKKQNKFKNFFLTIILIVLGIEIVQLLTASGRFDIDDIILNVSGAILMYFILKIKNVNKLIKNIFLLEKNKISKKSLIMIIVSILLVILGFMMLIKFRDKLYNDKYDEYNKIHNPQITIIDESNDVCSNELDLFYEDDLYKYYFTCIKSNKVYALVNDEEKYLVRDFMKNEIYNYDINRMLEILDFYDIDYIKENKYKYISLDVKVPPKSNDGYVSYVSPDIYIDIVDKNILNTKYEYIDNFEKETYEYKIFLIPKLSGLTTINIWFQDDENNIIETYKYLVKIDENLNIEYEKI